MRASATHNPQFWPPIELYRSRSGLVGRERKSYQRNARGVMGQQLRLRVLCKFNAYGHVLDERPNPGPDEPVPGARRAVGSELRRKPRHCPRVLIKLEYVSV
jgi:hypothetical protein